MCQWQWRFTEEMHTRDFFVAVLQLTTEKNSAPSAESGARFAGFYHKHTFC